MAAGASAAEPRPETHQDPGNDRRRESRDDGSAECGGEEELNEHASSDEPTDERSAPAELAARAVEQAPRDAADAGDSAVEEKEKCGREADEDATEGCDNEWMHGGSNNLQTEMIQGEDVSSVDGESGPSASRFFTRMKRPMTMRNPENARLSAACDTYWDAHVPTVIPATAMDVNNAR